VTTQVQTSIPNHKTPNQICEYCTRPFPTSKRLILHKGLNHYNEIDDVELEAFESAYTNEEDQLQTYRLKALGTLVLLYFAFLTIYALSI